MKLFFGDKLDHQTYNELTFQSLSFSILITFQWLNLIKHLRFWTGMVIFIETIWRTIIDIRTFLVLFIIVLFAVHDFMFFKHNMVTGQHQNTNYFKTIGYYYRILLFADFGDLVEQYDALDFCLFVLSTILIMIVLMNLLISTIGDSHERVKSHFSKM